MKSTFARLKKGQKAGFPKFKKRGVNDSFQVVPSAHFPIKRNGQRFRIPKVGKVKFHGNLRWPEGQQVNGRVKLKAGRWYLTLAYELPDPQKLPSGRPSCGVDLGCKAFATVASGGQLVQSVAPPKPYAKAKRRLKRFQRVISRRTKGGANRRKAVLRVAKAHKRITDIRQDFLHQLTSRLVKQFGSIGIENLNVSGMGK
jgi:putative transposase